MRRCVILAFAAILFSTSQLAAAEGSRVDRLVRQLRNGSVTERWQAARLLGTLGLDAKPAAVYLTIALHDENHTVRYYATLSLGAIGPAVGDIAGANLQLAAEHDPKAHVREQAGLALQAVKPTPLYLKVPWLYAGIDLPRREVLGEFRVGEYKPTVDLVKQPQPDEPEPPARPKPERADRKRKPRPLSPNNIRALVELLRGEPEQRDMAVRVLVSRMDSDGLASILVPMAMESKRELREVGMSALWNIEPQADAAAPLAYALHRKMGNAHTIEMIDKIKAGDVFSPYLLPYLVQSERPAIRQAGLEALIRISRKRDWRKLLAARWSHLDDEMHNKAKLALNSLSERDSFDLAFIAGELTNGNDASLVKMVTALAAVAKVKADRVRLLHQLYRAERSTVARMAIVWSLMNQKPNDVEESVALLVAIMEGESERPIREALVNSLREYGPAAETALPGLLRQLEKETSAESRLQIAEAIKTIGAGNRELLAIVIPLEESLRIQRAREILAGIIEDQQHLEEETQRKRKRSLLRLLGN